jgi:two-component system response regulator NreC
MKHSIMIVDDHPIIIEGIKCLLMNEVDVEVTEVASSPSEAISKLIYCDPELAIIDMKLGDEDGIDLIRQIRSLSPEVKLLAYSMSDGRLYAKRVAEAGAMGYVEKTQPPSVLKDAIRTVLRGDRYFSDKLLVTKCG